MIKIRLAGRPNGQFYAELNEAAYGEFEYFVDSNCVLHLWATEAPEIPQADLLQEFVRTVERRYADDRVLRDMQGAVKAIQRGVSPYQALGLVPPASQPTLPGKAREDGLVTALHVHRTFCRKRDLAVAVDRFIRKKGLSEDDKESVVRWYHNYRQIIDVLQSELLTHVEPTEASL